MGLSGGLASNGGGISSAAQIDGFGTHASRPAAGSVASGYIYFETDTGNAYQSQAGAWVQVAIASSAVASVFGRTGTVVKAGGDYGVADITGAAPLASPTFTGSPAAPTPTALDNSTKLATTAYDDAAVAVEKARAQTAEALNAPLTSVPTNVRSLSADATAVAGDFILMDATAANRTVTLPASVSGSQIVVKKTDSSANTVTVAGTIDGATNATLSYQNQGIALEGDGTGYQRVVRQSLATGIVDYPATPDLRYAQLTRLISTGTGLAGGGNLSADRTLAVDATVLTDARGSASQDLLVYSGSTFARLAVGSTGQQLSVRSDGTVKYTDPQVFNVKTYGAVVDGTTDDTTAVQAAITAAKAVGGIVFFPPGTTVVSALTALNTVTLRGAGMFKSTIKATALDTSTVITASNDCSQVVIEDLAIDGSAATSGHLLNFPFSSTGPKDVTVRRCYLHDVIAGANSAITFGFSATRVTIKDNYILNCAGWAISTSGNSANLYTDWKIHRNVLTNIQSAYTTTSGVPVGAIQIGSAWSRVEITENHITTVAVNGWAAGIRCSAPTASSTSAGLLISDNVITSTGDAGIFVQGSNVNGVIRGVTIEGNHVNGCTVKNGQNAAIYVNNTAASSQGAILDVTISDNMVYDQAGNVLGYGIELIGTNGTMTGNTVIAAQNPAMYVGIAQGTVTGNYISSPLGGYGIELEAASHVAVTGNTCDGCAYGGIAVGSAVGGASDHITLTGNVCTRNGHLATGNAFQYAGIVLRSATYCTVVGNTCTDNTNASANGSYGIYESGTGNNNLIASNDVRNNQAGAIIVTGAATIARHNPGYNPVGVVTVAVPATTAATTAAAYDQTFYVTNGSASTTLAISGGPTITVPASALCTVRVPAGQTLTPTYTVAPTWVVEAE